jgi:hypothetical protein
MAEFDKRLIPNYIAALAIIATFLSVIGYVVVTPDVLADLVIVDGDEGQTAFRAGGVGSLITAFIYVVKEVTSFLFRKIPSTPTP